jgi:hypothetical protein
MKRYLTLTALLLSSTFAQAIDYWVEKYTKSTKGTQYANATSGLLSLQKIGSTTTFYRVFDAGADNYCEIKLDVEGGVKTYRVLNIGTPGNYATLNTRTPWWTGAEYPISILPPKQLVVRHFHDDGFFFVGAQPSTGYLSGQYSQVNFPRPGASPALIQMGKLAGSSTELLSIAGAVALTNSKLSAVPQTTLTKKIYVEPSITFDGATHLRGSLAHAVSILSRELEAARYQAR